MRRTARSWAPILPVVVLGGAVGVAAAANAVYWVDADDHTVMRADLDGSNAYSVVQGGNCFIPIAVAVDALADRIYWTGRISCSASGIQHASLDGAGVETVPVDVGDSTGLAVGGGMLYWAEVTGSTGTIRRAHLDGSDARDLVGTGLYPWRLALDPDAGKIYWTEVGDSLVRRANLDGTDPEDLVGKPFEPIALALDLGHDRMFLSGPGSLAEAGLDGQGLETLLTGVTYPQDLALDLVGGKMYWVTNLSQNGNRLQRANLDGSDLEDVVVDLDRPKGIALLLDSVCGNGVVEPPEACDDGNNVDGDGCSGTCDEEIPVPATSGIAAWALAIAMGIAASLRLRRLFA